MLFSGSTFCNWQRCCAVTSTLGLAEMTGLFLIACALSAYDEEGEDGTEGVDEAEKEGDRKEWGREVIVARGSGRMIMKNELRAFGSGEVRKERGLHTSIYACLLSSARTAGPLINGMSAKMHGVCFSARCCYSSTSSA